MEAISALARVFSIPHFDRSEYYREQLKDDLMWIDFLHEMANKSSTKAFTETLEPVNEFMRCCTIPRAVVRAANASGLVPSRGAAVPCFEISRGPDGMFCRAMDEAGHVIMASTTDKSRRDRVLEKACMALVAAYPYGNMKMEEAEELIMVYALGATSHLKGGYGKDIFVPMPFTHKKYPRAPYSFYEALIPMLEGEEEFDIPNPWGKTREKIEPLISAYSKDYHWMEKQYMDKRISEITEKRGQDYVNAMMEWRKQRSGVFGLRI